MNKNKRFVIAETILTSRICKQHLYNVTDNLLFHQLRCYVIKEKLCVIAFIWFFIFLQYQI